MSTIPTIRISEVSKYDGQQIRLQGWLYNKRGSGKIHFLQLRDGTGIIQCVAAKNDVSEEDFEKGNQLTQESSFAVIGTVRKDARSDLGFELGVSSIELMQIAKDYPISPKEHGIAFLLDHRHLWLRSKRQHSIMKIRNTLIRAIRDYFDSKDFINLDAPIFTPNACEGTSTLFKTEYFGENAYLTQSGQLYMEAGAMAFGKVYCFGPTFRAEKSKTRRHLTEFWMVEPEVAFNDLEANMILAEDFLVYVVSRALEKHKEDFKIIERDTTKLEQVQKPFIRLSYDESIKKLNELGSPIQWGTDFGAEDETILTQQYDRPISFTDSPQLSKRFT